GAAAGVLAAAGLGRGAGGGASRVAPLTTMPGSSCWAAAGAGKAMVRGDARAMEERRRVRDALDENSFVDMTAPHDDVAWEHRNSSGRCLGPALPNSQHEVFRRSRQATALCRPEPMTLDNHPSL